MHSEYIYTPLYASIHILKLNCILTIPSCEGGKKVAHLNKVIKTNKIKISVVFAKTDMTENDVYFHSLQFISLQAGQCGEGLNTFSLWGRKGREANQVNMDKT